MKENQNKIKQEYLLSTAKNIFVGHIQLNCLSPEFAFRALQSLKPRSIIITSGTLNPMQRFQESLGLDNCLTPFTAGSVINQQNIHVRKIGRDLKSIPLQIKYQYFFNEKYFVQNAKLVFNLIIELIERIPNGVLIMVSSYALSQKLQKFFKSQDALQIKSRFRKAKPFVAFQKKDTNAEQLIKKYNYFAKKKAGAVLFCVCRAKLTEGIDFKDQLCRGVIVIGIPYLSEKLPQVIRMLDYLKNEKKDQYYQNWMLIQIAKAINQALGRVVRDQNDYGSIFLIDARYNNKSYGSQSIIRKNISEWIRRNWIDIQNKKQLQEQLNDLKAFFDRHQQKKQSKQQSNKKQKNLKQDDEKDPGQNRKKQNIQDLKQSLRPTYNQKIQQSSFRQLKLPQLKVRQSVQRDLDQNKGSNSIKDYEMVSEQQDKDYQKATNQSIRNDKQKKTITERLDKKMLNKGLIPKIIKGDGNCLYRTVSYLQTQKNNQNDFQSIKNLVLQVLDRQLEGPPHLVQKILQSGLVEGSNDQQKIRNYKERVSRKNEYGTQNELLAMSFIFGVAYVVHRIGRQEQIYYPNPNVPITPQYVYHIGYYEFQDRNYNHFFALVPQMPLKQYNTLYYSRQIQIWNEQQKKFVQPFINVNKLLRTTGQTINQYHIPQHLNDSMIDQTERLPTPQRSKLFDKDSINQSMIQPILFENSQQTIQHSNTSKSVNNTNIAKTLIDYKSKEKIISQLQIKQFSLNGTITYSSSGTILSLNNSVKNFKIEELFSNSWQNVQILEIQNCHIFDSEWKKLTSKAGQLPNLRYISIGSNRIKEINQGDLQRFRNLKVINFKKLQNPTPQTIKYLQSLLKRYKNSEDKSQLLYPIFRK